MNRVLTVSFVLCLILCLSHLYTFYPIVGSNLREDDPLTKNMCIGTFRIALSSYLLVSY